MELFKTFQNKNNYAQDDLLMATSIKKEKFLTKLLKYITNLYSKCFSKIM